jgi:methylphosphotriester-DNA--protein-cysteine methyltransferase
MRAALKSSRAKPAYRCSLDRSNVEDAQAAESVERERNALSPRSQAARIPRDVHRLPVSRSYLREQLSDATVGNAGVY